MSNNEVDPIIGTQYAPRFVVPTYCIRAILNTSLRGYDTVSVRVAVVPCGPGIVNVGMTQDVSTGPRSCSPGTAEPICILGRFIMDGTPCSNTSSQRNTS